MFEKPKQDFGGNKMASEDADTQLHDRDEAADGQIYDLATGERIIDSHQ